METRNCQNCKNDFNIESDDFSFYEKIKVPAPTFCPECRMVRRLIWRNERSLYKRECGLCKKSLVSMYREDGAPVYCNECWNGTNWDQFTNAKEYSFEIPFFDQLRSLFAINPRFYAYKFGSFVNSDFVNFAKDDKNTYLSYSVIDCEDISYSTLVDKSKNSIDCFNAIKVDTCSYNIYCEGNYNVHYAVKSQNCIDSNFIYDCANCQNCTLSSNLRNQQYYFKNKKLSKEEYQNRVKELHLETYTGFENTKKEFDSIVEGDTIHKYAFIYASQNVTGDYIHNKKKKKNCFDTYESENISYSNRVLYAKDCMDLSGGGYCEATYESMAATMNTSMDFFCYITIQGCRECEYSLILKNCSNCFGCVGLTNAQYCILNKQYTKEEYFETVAKIKQHMMEMPYVDKNGRVFTYGEFFPYDMCPFSYNETNAHDYFPITKEEALLYEYPWKDREKREYTATKNAIELPDSINEVEDTIVSEIIACPSEGDPNFLCTSAFRVTPEELQFYRKMKLPLPRYCPNCRHYQRLEYKNPWKLYTRLCTNGCGNNIETTYAPDRPETVYCEKCYQQEVL
mgnify:CR=1 FL=1